MTEFLNTNRYSTIAVRVKDYKTNITFFVKISNSSTLRVLVYIVMGTLTTYFYSVNFQ